MLAVLDEAEWCDMQGRPVRRTAARKRRHNNSMDSSSTLGNNRLKRISQFLFRFGILAFAFFYCIGSQFLALRRLTVAEMKQKPNDTIDDFNLGIELMTLSNYNYNYNNNNQDDIRSITNDRRRAKLGTSLLGRIEIQTESMQAKEAIDTTSQIATHTRRLGPAAKGRFNSNNRIGKWPILQTQTTNLNSDTTTDTVDAKMTANVSNSNSNSNSNTRTVTRKRILGARLKTSNSQSVPNSKNPRTTTRTVSDSNGGRVTTTATSTSTSTAKRTRNTKFKKSLNYKIVGFTDYNFRDVALKWYQRLEELGYHQHSLVVYDNAMADYIEGLNEERSYELTTNMKTNIAYHTTNLANTTTMTTTTTPSTYRFEKYLLPPLPKTVLRSRRDERHRKNLEMMYAHRWHYVLEQLQNGTSILMSNVDTIFNKHLNLENQSDFLDYDMILHSYNEGQGQGQGYLDNNEEEEQQQQSVTIHSGMIWLQSNSKTIQFVQKLVEKCKTMCNDTMVLNELIAKTLEMEWDNKHDFENENENKNEKNHGLTGRSKLTGHTVKVLDNHHCWVYSSGGQECPETNPWIVVIHPHHHHHHHHHEAAADKKAESSSAQKLALFDTWDEGCGKQWNLKSGNHSLAL